MYRALVSLVVCTVALVSPVVGQDEREPRLVAAPFVSLAAMGVEADLEDRYRLGREALVKIQQSTANVNEVLGVAALEQTIGLGVNPWSDQDFRNWADRTSNWLGGLGLAAAAVMTVVSPSNENEWVGTGLSMSAVSQAIGAIWGAQTGSKFEDKAKFVEFTRKAYDDIATRNVIAKANIRSNESLISQIDSFLVQYDSAGRLHGDQGKAAMHAALVESSSYLGQFDMVLLQIPTMYDMYEEVLRSYCSGALEVARTDPSNLGGVTCRTHRPGQSPFELEGETKTLMLQAAAQLVRLQRNRSAANQIRLLSPNLRAALLGASVE